MKQWMNYQTPFGNKMAAALELAFLWLGRDFVRFSQGAGALILISKKFGFTVLTCVKRL